MAMSHVTNNISNFHFLFSTAVFPFEPFYCFWYLLACVRLSLRPSTEVSNPNLASLQFYPIFSDSSTPSMLHKNLTYHGDDPLIYACNQ